MKVTDFPPLEIEIPVGLMPLLLMRAEQPLSEIQKVLGVSDQVFHEFCNGRGRLSPMKAGRIAALARLSPRELTWVAETAKTWKKEDRPKEGVVLTHPFRGAAKVRAIDQGTVDLLLMPKERPMNGVPLLVFEKGFIEATLVRIPDVIPSAEVEKPLSKFAPVQRTAEGHRKIPDEDVVPQSEVTALFDRSGLDKYGLASLIGISPSVISSHSQGRTAMSRARFQRLEAAVARIPSKTAGKPVKQAPVKNDRSKPTQPKRPEIATAGGFAAKDEVVKTIRTSGLTLKQIAALLGISDSMVGHYMTGRNKMSEKRYAELLAALKERHVQTDPVRKLTVKPPLANADQSSAAALEAALSKPAAVKLPDPPATIFVTELTEDPAKPVGTLPLAPSEDRVKNADQLSEPASAMPTKSPAEAMLEMLDLVQVSLAELFGGRDLLARRMAHLDHLPAATAIPALDPAVLAEIRAAQDVFDRRLSGMEIQMAAVRAEIAGVSEILQRLESRIAATQAPTGCSVTRLARLLAAD